MADKSRGAAPAQTRGARNEAGFDLARALESIVSLQAMIPDDAFTAKVLGVKRAGSGVVIRESGLILTIGYLITEAQEVWLTSADGRVVPGHALALDTRSGFGLVQALDRLDLPAMEIGSSSKSAPGDPVIVAAGGKRQFLRATIAGKQEFAGYWEYFLDEAIFTAPAHPFWGGAALIGADGKLLGIGSLHVERVTEEGPQDSNMIVPIDLLTPVLDALVARGRPDGPARPWLGVYSAESEGKIVVAEVAENGPAAIAGMRRGDVISAVRDASIASLRDFYAEMWKSGPAGVEIPIEVVRGGRGHWLRVKSADRASFLKKPRLH